MSEYLSTTASICQAVDWFQISQNPDGTFFASRVAAWVATASKRNRPAYPDAVLYEVVPATDAGCEGMAADYENNHVALVYGPDPSSVAGFDTWTDFYNSQPAPQLEGSYTDAEILEHNQHQTNQPTKETNQ